MTATNNLNKAAETEWKEERYRVEYGSVYEYSEDHRAYLFIGKLNGRSLKSFLRDYQNSIY